MLYILFNPHSGNGGALSKIGLIKKNYPDLDFFLYQTRFVNDEAYQIQNMLTSFQAKKDKLLIIGGDGTLSKALNHLPVDIPFAYLPAGSGNDFYRSLPAYSFEVVLAALQSNQLQTIHVFQSENYLILNNLGLGFDARVISYSESSRLKHYLNKLGLGKLIYTFFGIRSAFSNESLAVTLSNGDGTKQFLDNLFLFVLANNSYFGGGIQIWPDANVHKPLLDLIYFKKGNLYHNIRGLLSLILKKQAKNQAIQHQTYRELILELPKPQVAQIDGELVTIYKEHFKRQERQIYL